MKTITQSQTSTSSITNTKLAIATLAMLAAGGSALATIPLTQEVISQKTFTVKSCQQATTGVYVVPNQKTKNAVAKRIFLRNKTNAQAEI